jgi:FtsP/CotA-like multicopper oxidase with cupredoxin domain
MNRTQTRLVDFIDNVIKPVHDPFDREIAGLPQAINPEVVELQDGATFELRAAPVRKRLGDVTVKLLAYNGSIPGPTIKVPQGAEVTIHFTNALDLDTTVHWHGLRLDNRFDGVAHGEHHGMQPPVIPGGSFTYQLCFPDPGLYWYHPHLREDYAQEHGLYGNILVTPSDPNYWSPVHREEILVLDDILLNDDKVAPFSQSEANYTTMGRFGNVMLVNGETNYTLPVNQGEVMRLYLTNTANVRTFNVGIPGVQMKVVGSDSGRIEHEQWVEEVLISPSERVILELYFAQAGRFAIEHHTRSRVYPLGTIDVRHRIDSPGAQPALTEYFFTLRQSSELIEERRKAASDFDRPPDKTLLLIGEMDKESDSDIQAEDTMRLHNGLSAPRTMHWKLVDPATGAANHAIDWSFEVGQRVKIRMFNEPKADHPMQHPMHFHGQRFLVLSRDGVRNDNLAWKDTVLVSKGETVDILLEATNPGVWMAHCHIAEHAEAHMMFNFSVGQRATHAHHHASRKEVS